jgi:hypothetical protein
LGLDTAGGQIHHQDLARAAHFHGDLLGEAGVVVGPERQIRGQWRGLSTSCRRGLGRRCGGLGTERFRE